MRLTAALTGALAGLLAGAASAWLVAADPGPGRGAAGTLRAEVDSVEQRLAAIDARVSAAEAAWQAGAAGRRGENGAAGAAAQAEQLRALVEDLRALRESVRAELGRVDERLTYLRRRIDDVAVGSAAGNPSREGPPSPEDEERWATLARDPDPGKRFSALSRLGRVRTDRSAQVAVERLADDDVKVLWLAIRCLGRFRERDAAPQVAPFLGHSDTVVRAEAFEALIRMGAPTDTGYEASDPPEKRKAAAEALKHWAEE